MLTNGPPPSKPQLPGPQCHFSAQSECRGNLHEYTARMFAKLDGTPVIGAPEETTYICENHYPDKTDPKFLLCGCRLCRERRSN